MTTLYRERSCRVCAGELESILDLGALHPSGFLRPDEAPLSPVPHDLCVCVECRLVQLRHTVEPDLMFRQYWYLSGINEVMCEELADIVAKVCERIPLTTHDSVVDIGANDGTLLAAYPENLTKIGFEPALNLNDALHRYADITIADYFPRGLAQMGARVAGTAKVITAIACFYDLDDPITFLRAVAELLHPEGIFVVQFQDWHQMQQATAFDNICTEHLFYPSLAAIERMAQRVGLVVVDGERRAINGGSLRLYLQHEGRRLGSHSVEALRHLEEGCEDWDTFQRFGWRCREVRRQIQSAVAAADVSGIVDVYGASTKFSTLAQWCRLGGSLRQAWERSPAKFGRRTPGTNIPIVDEVVGRLDPPDALLLGIWQFRDAVLRRERQYLDQGGTVLVPLPVVDIVRGGHD